LGRRVAGSFGGGKTKFRREHRFRRGSQGVPLLGDAGVAMQAPSGP